MSKSFTVFTKNGESDSLTEPTKIAFTLERRPSSTAATAWPVVQMVMLFQPNGEQSQVFRWDKDMKLAFSLFERKARDTISVVGEHCPVPPVHFATLRPSGNDNPVWAQALPSKDLGSQKNRFVSVANATSQARLVTLGYLGHMPDVFKPLACYNVPRCRILRAPSDFVPQVYDISGTDLLADMGAGETALLTPTEMKNPMLPAAVFGEALPDASSWKLCRDSKGALFLANQDLSSDPKGPCPDSSSQCDPPPPFRLNSGSSEDGARWKLPEVGPGFGRPPPYYPESMNASGHLGRDPDTKGQTDERRFPTSLGSPVPQFPIWRSGSAPPELSSVHGDSSGLWEPGNASGPIPMPVPMVSRATGGIGAVPLRNLQTPTPRAPMLDSEPRMITIYTSRAEESTTLKVSVQIVLTVTPKDQSMLFVSQTPIAWQVLDFDARKDLDFTVTWQPGIGFCTVRVDAERVVTTHAGVHVPLGSWAGLEKNPAAQYQWSKAKRLADSLGKSVAARNATRVPQTFAICSVEGIASDEHWKFEPFVHLAPTRPNTNAESGPPIMLQAYAVSGYKKNQLLKLEDHEKGRLLTSNEEDPDPINIQTLEERPVFHLYSDRSGGVTLKYESSLTE